MSEAMLSLLEGRTWMLFVDGENLTRRGQDALDAAGIQPDPGPWWERDVYLWPARAKPKWQPLTQEWYGFGSGGRSRLAGDLRRSYYYTSRPNDGPGWTAAQLAIRDIGFEPRVFPRRQGRSKAVDIALATDVLTYGASGQYDAAVVVTCDGDYVPVLEAVKRLGLHVGVGCVGTCSPELRIAADAFVDLSEALVDAWKGYHEDRAREEEQRKRAGEQPA